MTEDTAPRLRNPAHLVCRRAVPYWTVRAAIGWVVNLAIVWTAWVLIFDGPPWWATTIAVAVSVAAVAHVAVMPTWRYRVHRWELTGTGVFTQAGWLTRERRIAPLSRVQTVDSERGPLMQLFRLTSITITTASAAGPLGIEGLDKEVAGQVIHDLTVATERSEGDAT